MGIRPFLLVKRGGFDRVLYGFIALILPIDIARQISSSLVSYQQGIRWFFDNHIIQNDYKY